MWLEQTLAVVLTPVLKIFDPVVQTTTAFVASQKIQRVVIRSFVSVLAAVILVSVAVWSYFIFYWIYVPELSILNSVWFQYGYPHPAIVGNAIPVLPKAEIDLTLGGRYTQPFHDDQLYSAVLELYVPTSRNNVDLGNFMVSLALKNAENATVHYSARPAILRYRSSLLHTLSTFYRALPLLLEFSEESQRLRVKLIEGFVGDHSNPITTAELTLSTPQLQLYSARLYLNAHLSGLRYLMYYWPISTATSFIAIFLFWEIVFTVSTWRLVGRLYPSQFEAIDKALSEKDDTETAPATEEEPEKELGDEPEDGEETEVPEMPGDDDESVPPTPTTTTSFGIPSTASVKEGFDTENDTEASMSLYGDDEETETEAEGFQEVPRGRRA